VAGRAAARLAVDGRHRLGHGLCGAAVAGCSGGARTLGERFGGYLVTERWSAYTGYPLWRRQLCWAHLRRDIEAMIVRGGGSQAIGEALRAQARQMFPWWHRVRDGTLAPARVASAMRPIRPEGERWLDVGQPWGGPKTAGGCRALRKVRQARWTFGRHPAVEPTHHAAERAIRPGVLWRKGRVGTHRAQGAPVVDAMMTRVATRTQPHRHVLAAVTAAGEAILPGAPAPSVRPSAETLPPLMPRAASLDRGAARLRPILRQNLHLPQNQGDPSIFKAKPYLTRPILLLQRSPGVHIMEGSLRDLK
jgi:hypothetical protein